MREEFNFPTEPFAGYTLFDEFEASSPELFEGETSYEWMGEVSRSTPEYVSWAQQALNQAIRLRLAVDGREGPQTRSAIRRFQQRVGLRMDGVVGPKTEKALSNATGTAPPVTSGTPASGAPGPGSINTPLPESGPGFRAYKREQARRYGLPETIRALQVIAEAWLAAHPQGPRIEIGDISFQGGGRMPPHKSHNRGVDVDIRLIRNDGREGGSNFRAANYSRSLTQELVNLIRANSALTVKLVYFNDPAVRGVTDQPGHDDHLHVRFCAPSDTGCRPSAQREMLEWGEMEFETPPAVRRRGSAGTDCGRSGSPAASVSQPGGRCTGSTPPVCPPVPGILSVQSIGAIPFEYVASVSRDPATNLTTVNQRLRPRTQRFLPPVQLALTQFVANMSRFGLPIEAILTAGSYCCRCISKTNRLSNHSHGDAFDLVGVRWAAAAGRETIVHNWNNSERAMLRRINACLRLSFATVIDYHRSDHRDHFHCDTNRGQGRNLRAPETLRFTQEALGVVLNRSLPITGRFDAATQRALVEFAGGTAAALSNSAQLNQILDRLFTQIASTAAIATQPAARPAPAREVKTPAPSSVTRMLPCEDPARNPPGLTLCEKIILGGEGPAPPLTGIFLPVGYQPQPQVDLIIYLHGHKIPSGLSASATIADFWSPSHPFQFREGLNASGKNAILVAPTLGVKSSATKLTDEKFGLDWYVDQVMKVLVTRGPYKGAAQPPAVGSIVIACHSGGGKVMRQLALMKHRYSGNIREFWGFDCLYNPADPQMWRLAMAGRNAQLFIYFLNSTASISKTLGGQGRPPNIQVERSTAASHGLVPITHWKARIQQAEFLRNMHRPR